MNLYKFFKELILLIDLLFNRHHFTSKDDNQLSSLPSLVRMVVHFEISVEQLFGGIGQPVSVADKRSALQDQVCLVSLQDVFAQAWIVQQADR